MKREPSFRRRPNKRALVFNVRVMLSTCCDVHVTPPSEWRTGTLLRGNWDTHIPREGTAQLKITAPPCSASLEERKHYSVVISSSFQIPVWKPAPERWLKWISWLIWLLFTATVRSLYYYLYDGIHYSVKKNEMKSSNGFRKTLSAVKQSVEWPENNPN